MQLHGTNNYVESNIKGKSRGFAIEASHKAFKILSDSLYKDKITAVIRELSTNALDAHTEAGNSDPFIVHLPTALEPYFSVTDRGIGMGQEEVATLYTTYFSSSKTNSNDVIGALGLGSKSPFSYTESFNIEAIKNGRKGVYTCFISSDGMPTVQLIEEVDSTEHNGVSISFAVRENDFDTFINKAARIYWAFDRKPIITGATTRYAELSKWYDTVTVSAQSDSWALYAKLPEHLETGYKSRAQIKMGNIIYPISRNMIENHLGDRERFVVQNSFIVNVALGVCDIAPSREELNYDEQTIVAILGALNATFDNFTSSIMEEASNQDTAWKAICSVVDAVKNVNSIPEFTLNYKGRDFVVGQQLKVEGLSAPAIVASNEKSRSRVTLIDRSAGRDVKVTPSSAVQFISCSNSNQMTSYHHRSRIRYFIENTSTVSTVVLLHNATADDMEKFGNPDVMYFDNLPKVLKNTSTPKIDRRDQAAVTWGSHTPIDMSKLASRKQKTPFVVLKNQAYFPVVNGELGNKYDKDILSGKIKHLVNAQVLDTNDLVIVPYMTWKSMKPVFTTSKWVTIDEYVTPKIVKEIHSIQDAYKQHQISASILDRYDFLIKNLDVFEATQFSENSLFRNFLTSISTFKVNAQANSSIEDSTRKLMRAAEVVNNNKVLELIRSLQKGAVEDQFNLTARYPMLALITESWELRRGGMNRYTFGPSGGVKAIENNETSVATAVTQYIKLIDSVA
jgi:hypothetical protein